MNHGVDRYRRPAQALARAGAGDAQGPRGLCAAAGQRHVAHAAAAVRRTRPRKPRRAASPSEPQENLLYFIEKNAPLLEPWQREVVRIVRKIAQYFYPQRQTQVMNEGWATFWHHKLLNTMYDDGYLSDGMMIEWLKSHTNVVAQPAMAYRHQSVCVGIRDVHGHQAHLRAADRRGPRVVPDARRRATGCRRWTTRCATSRTRASSAQYLSPKLMREFRLFSILDDEHQAELRDLRDPR